MNSTELLVTQLAYSLWFLYFAFSYLINVKFCAKNNFLIVFFFCLHSFVFLFHYDAAFFKLPSMFYTHLDEG